MKRLLKPLRQAIPNPKDELMFIVPSMRQLFGAVVDVKPTKQPYYGWTHIDAKGLYYREEWFVRDHELLKVLKKHL